jgi:hypothetical protein
MSKIPRLIVTEAFWLTRTKHSGAANISHKTHFTAVARPILLKSQYFSLCFQILLNRHQLVPTDCGRRCRQPQVSYKEHPTKLNTRTCSTPPSHSLEQRLQKQLPSEFSKSVKQMRDTQAHSVYFGPPSLLYNRQPLKPYMPRRSEIRPGITLCSTSSSP